MCRLLLIELNNGVSSRNERLMYLPFVRGMAEKLLIPSLWLRVGTSFRFKEGRNELGCFFRLLPETLLPSPDLETLVERLRSFGPSHVLVAGQTPPGFLEVLREAAPSATVAETPPPHRPYFEPDAGAGAATTPEVFKPCADSELERFVGRCAWLLSWLGRADAPGREEFLVSFAPPDYGYVNVNAAAERIAPFLSLVSGTPCVNRRTIAANPLFDGVTEPELAEYGCSFCKGDQPRVSARQVSSVEVVEAQLDAFLATSPVGRDLPLEVDVYDIGLFHGVDRFFDMALSKKLPVTTFRFSPRVAELLAAESKLFAVLPRLQRRGFKVVLHAVGVENFSDVELHRFNKPESPARVDRAVALLKSLQERFPGTFRGSEERGSSFGQLSFILFSPWTTLGDLRENLERGKALGFDENGAWLLKALVFHEGRPLTRLAMTQDGVAAERYDDIAMEYAITGMGSAYYHYDVRPWRFQDRAVADLFGWLARVCAAWEGSDSAEQILGEDEGYRFARETVCEAGRQGLSLHAVAMSLLARLEEQPGRPLSCEDVAEALGANKSKESDSGETGQELDAPAPEPEADPEEEAEGGGRGTMLFAARRRDGSGAEQCFHMASHELESRYLKRVGDLILWYNHADYDADSRDLTRALVAAMRARQEGPPTAAALPEWRATLATIMESSGLDPRFEWRLEWERR